MTESTYDDPAHPDQMDSTVEAPAIRMLIVDDDPVIVEALAEFFEGIGYAVTCAADGVEALQWMQRRPSFDIVLLDVMLPGKSGFDVLRESHEMGLVSPVLMVSGRGEHEAILQGFGLGATDYVVKPFEPDELATRVKAILGRAASAEVPSSCEIGGIVIDLERGVGLCDGSEITFSEVEVDLLRYLAQNRGLPVTRKRLLRDALGIDEETVTFTVDQHTVAHTLDRHISSLRAKVEPHPYHPAYIETVYGLGYRLNT